MESAAYPIYPACYSKITVNYQKLLVVFASQNLDLFNKSGFWGKLAQFSFKSPSELQQNQLAELPFAPGQLIKVRHRHPQSVVPDLYSA